MGCYGSNDSDWDNCDLSADPISRNTQGIPRGLFVRTISAISDFWNYNDDRMQPNVQEIHDPVQLCPNDVWYAFAGNINYSTAFCNGDNQIRTVLWHES